MSGAVDGGGLFALLVGLVGFKRVEVSMRGRRKGKDIW